MPPLSAIPSDLNPILHNPSQTLHPTVQGYLGYLSVFVISGCIYPLVGPLVILVQSIKMVWHFKQLEIVKTQLKIENQKMGILQAEVDAYLSKIELSTSDEETEDLSKKMTSVNTEKGKLKAKLTWLDADKHNKIMAYRESKQKFIASMIALIPFFGVFTAGYYLKESLLDIQEDGVRGCVEAISYASVEGSEGLIQTCVYPLRNASFREEYQSNWAAIYFRNQFINLGALEVKIPVKRGDHQNSISAFTLPNSETEIFDSDKPVMVLFHGNGQSKETMNERAEFYRGKKFNVLVVTMGGYPWSDEGVKTSEMTTYQDAHAVINYLKDKGFKNIGIHGLSIGGTLAFAAAELHPDVVKFVVAEQTLGKAKDVAVNILRNQSDLIPDAVIRGVVGSAFPVDRLVSGVTDLEGKPYLTDGLNNVRKANHLREQAENGVGNCQVYGIRAKKDLVMGRIRDANGGFKENCVDDILMARYSTLEGHVRELAGGHCAWFSHPSQSEELSEQLATVFFS